MNKEFLRLIKAKLYNDGAHNLGIMLEKGKSGKKRGKPLYNEPIVIEEEIASEDMPLDAICDAIFAESDENCREIDNKSKDGKESKKKIKRISTLSEEFKRYYRQTLEMRYREKFSYIWDKMEHLFTDVEKLYRFVDYKLKNATRAKRTRINKVTRRASLHGLNQFYTFTYDSAKVTEDEFAVKLLTCLRHLSSRRGWKYIGAWERGEANNRLHFHALIYIPEGQMVGTVEHRREYDPVRKCMTKFDINTFFEDRFGRNTIEKIDGIAFSHAMAAGYLVKYLEKQGGRIICSKGLNTFAEVEVNEEDVLIFFKSDERKFVLIDNFRVYKNGRCLGIFSRAMLPQLKLTG